MGNKTKIKLFLSNISITGWSLIALGVIVWSATMVKSGIKYQYGIGFWGPNGHDGVWHIAVIESLTRGWWKMPVFASSSLQNYHLGFNLLVAWFHKITFIPVTTLYFQIIPPLLVLFIGLFVYLFIFNWRKSKTQAFWATFFAYFGGGFGWVVTLLRGGGIGGESLFWSQQSISTLINPPFALSILIIILALNYLIAGLKSGSKRKRKLSLTVATFLFGVLIQIKVYAGILSLGGLFVTGMWMMLRRKGLALMKVFSGALIVSILLFFPLSSSLESTVIFKPFWFLETMMSFTDRLNWQKFGEAMVNYKLGGVWIKGVVAYFVAFIIFVIGNFGTRVISFIWFRDKAKNFKNVGYLDIYLASVIAGGIFLPILFVQRGTAWNTIQFIYYSLMFSGILAGIWFGDYLEKKSKKFIILNSLFIILLTIPTTIGTLKHYLPARPPAKVSHEELEALRFLSSQPNGVVLTQLFDKDAALAAEAYPPRPLYLYESTAYVSAFSKKPTYLEDEVNLEITGYDWIARREEIENFLANPDRNYLKENNISYIYWVRDHGQAINKVQLGVEKVFENEEVDIYEVVN